VGRELQQLRRLGCDRRRGGHGLVGYTLQLADLPQDSAELPRPLVHLPLQRARERPGARRLCTTDRLASVAHPSEQPVTLLLEAAQLLGTSFGSLDPKLPRPLRLLGDLPRRLPGLRRMARHCDKSRAKRGERGRGDADRPGDRADRNPRRGSEELELEEERDELSSYDEERPDRRHEPGYRGPRQEHRTREARDRLDGPSRL